MSALMPTLLFATSAMLTPGPNNFMIMNSGLNFGMRRSMPHFLGVALGFPAMVLIVALGFGELFNQYSWIKAAFKVIGTLYMLYLAWQILVSQALNDVTEAKPIQFTQAVLFQWVNPKAWICLISAISVFSLAANPLLNAVFISLVFLLVLAPSLGIWLYFGVSLKELLRNPRYRRIFNALMAACLVGSIILL